MTIIDEFATNNTVDIIKSTKVFRKNGHTIPVKKSNNKWGLRGTTRYDSDDEQVVWKNLIQYLYDRNIHDYRYLIK